MCTPPDQSILVKTPRTSTPSLKTVVGNHVDKRLNHGETSSAGNKAGLDSKGKVLPLSVKKTDQQAQSSNKTNQQGLSSKKTDQQGHNSKKTNQPGQDCKKTDQQGQNSSKTDQKGQGSKKTDQQGHSSKITNQPSKKTDQLGQNSKKTLHPCQGSKKTNQQGQRSKIINQEGQNGKKADHQSHKNLCKRDKKDGFDDHKWVAPTKKSASPLRVTENNIDSFLNQLSSKPMPVTKKYTTRSSVKQLKVLDNKAQNKENVTKKEKPYTNVGIKQRSASPVVKLQQAKRHRITVLPQNSLSAFDFDDDESVPVTKKARQIDTSVSSSCNSSLEMSRLNASLLARGSTSKSFSMTPQKKGRNKRSPPNKKPVSVCLKSSLHCSKMCPLQVQRKNNKVNNTHSSEVCHIVCVHMCVDVSV